jgi:hypothetical protein
MAFEVCSDDGTNVERHYRINGTMVKAYIDFKEENIRLRASGFDRLYPFSSYLKFPGDMEDFIKHKVML